MARTPRIRYMRKGRTPERIRHSTNLLAFLQERATALSLTVAQVLQQMKFPGNAKTVADQGGGGQPPTPPVVSISGTPTATEGGNLIFNVSLNKAATEALTIPVTYSGTALAAHYTKQNSVSIAIGATAGVITVPTADNSVVEGSRTVIATLDTGTGYTLGTASATGTITDNDVAPAAALRTVVQNNVIQNAKETRGKTGYATRWPYIIGSGAVKEVLLSFNNWILLGNNTMANNGSALNLVKASVEYNGVVVPVTFGGSRTVTIADGASDLQSDVIPATAFGGITSLPVGAIIYVKTVLLLPATTATVPSNAKNAAQSGAAVRWYDPAVTTLSDADVAGQFTSTGTAPETRTGGMSPLVLGRYVTGDPNTYIFIGDSITQGTGDGSGSGRIGGLGWAARALTDADGTSNPKSFINFAVHGSASTAATADDRLYNFYKYATRATLFYGTNDLGQNGAGATLATMQGRLTTIAQNLKTKPGSAITKILAGHLLPRATSTDAWATLENQTPTGAGWDAGGVVPQLNDWLTSQVGVLFDGYTHFQSVRNTGNDFRWATNGTANYAATDETHPSTGGHTLMANDARAALATMG